MQFELGIDRTSSEIELRQEKKEIWLCVGFGTDIINYSENGSHDGT